MLLILEALIHRNKEIKAGVFRKGEQDSILLAG